MVESAVSGSADVPCACAAGVADEKLSFADIQQRANLPDEDVIRILHSMACGKYKILAKEPVGKTINKADMFSMNHAFTDRMRRIKVGRPGGPAMLCAALAMPPRINAMLHHPLRAPASEPATSSASAPRER